jgi:signal transduction histidine kinase
MSPTLIAQIFFIYGLAFFAMGMAIYLEMGRASDPRLRRALRLLAFFGLVHGAHEWLEMFQGLEILPLQLSRPAIWQNLRIVALATSFLGLAGFGISLLVREDSSPSWRLIGPLGMTGIWGIGILAIRNQLGSGSELWDALDVWTRYSLAVPSALLAASGLLALRRSFRQAGMEQFGRDSVVAAAAFAVYGVVGQVFTRPSLLPPSTVINTELFIELTGFPVQLLRTAAATIVAIFVIRFMRSFEVERQRKLAELQADRLREAERRQTMRGELLNRVVQAQEAERQRIARELHDETGQALTAIGMGLRGIAGKADRDGPIMGGLLAHLEELTSHALNELQRLIAGLRPSHLDDLGLAAALRWYAGEIEARSPLLVEVEVSGDEPPMPASLSVGLFRVAQEALTNVVKHASANRAVVMLIYEQDRVRLEVHDDGIGFDAPGADRPSWGLMGMQERISLMGGEFLISSERGRGTHITVSVPAELGTEQEHDRTLAVGG